MRAVGRAFSLAIQDWWNGLIPLAVVNVLWLVCVLTVIGGPPGTAALLVVARGATGGHAVDPRTFVTALRPLFWRSWGLGAVSAAGTLFLTVDWAFYRVQLQDLGLGYGAGMLLLTYALVVWLEFLLIAWPLLVDQPHLRLRDVLRNAGILTLRYPAANLGLAVLVLLLVLIALVVAPMIGLAVGAMVALLAQHYLNQQVPALGVFPPLPGEGLEPSGTAALDSLDSP
ncbi:MAG TPA: DUF624 domain-containing protein [Chloroflexia bacterium]|nr:DUF624 domain-containing protein [Chloroflexia bacterium]